MGCASSKILTRSGSIQDELKRRLPGRSKRLKELKASKNGGDRQLFALLYPATTVAKTTNSVPLLDESETKSDAAAVEHTGTRAVDDANPPMELAEAETINAWEMLDGLEEDAEAEAEGSNQYKSTASDDTATSEGIRSNLEDERFVVHTVEDYDAMVEAANELEEGKKRVAEVSKDQQVQVSSGESDGSTREPSASTPAPKVDQKENNTTIAKASRRKAMAKDLSAIKIPSLDFSRSGSLRDWLLGGGQVMSPGSYVTPKFGNSDKEEPAGALDHAVFDPEMVAQFERAMEELTVDEESILEQILESLKEGHENDVTGMEMS